MTRAPSPEGPTDVAQEAASRPDYPTGLLNLPWIDVHNHAHTLSWSERERYGLAGCQAMVMVASGNHWIPYRPVRAADFRYLWDQAIDRQEAIDRNQFFNPWLAIGIQTGVRVADPPFPIGCDG